MTTSNPLIRIHRFSFWGAVVLVCFVKFLFLKSYRSTDFEVHRNWLAITHSLPLENWYYEETSEWTLDYPPLFAYFEWTLAQAAAWIDPKMLNVKNLNYASPLTIFFQKASVIAADLVFAYSVKLCAEAIRSVLPGRLLRRNLEMSLFALIFLNGGLFMVDHIHFQYNGFLYGILLLSIAKILQGKHFQGALLFAILLNLKHIFLYIAPAYGIYLFTNYCVRSESEELTSTDKIKNFTVLSGIVVSIFLGSFGPFYLHVQQILKRLFPFGRGLSHAYWAPNIWALYNTADLGLSVAKGKGKSGVTGGLVGENSLAVLPMVQPIHTFVLTALLMLPILYKIWKKPTNRSFLNGVIITAWTSYMFGYHVHEKAILNVIIPLALVAIDEPRLFMLALIPGTFSLFPLLFTSFEALQKLNIALIHTMLSLLVIPSLQLRWYELLYVLGFLPLYCLEFILPFLLPKLPFLYLICVSDYCFIGLFYTYIKFYYKSLVQV